MPVPGGFDELIPNTIANATVDRLMHHAHIVMTPGDSIRLTQATAGKGVTPLGPDGMPYLIPSGRGPPTSRQVRRERPRRRVRPR